jgi:ribonuclease HII
MSSRSLVAGVDEAGRGSVIGPLVIAGVSLPVDRVRDLKDIGVKDSKLLTPKQRLKLAGEIEGVVTAVSYGEISVAEIDRAVLAGRRYFKLNYLEAKFMAKVIDALKPSLAYVDAADVVAKRFGRRITSMTACRVKVISEHRADRRYPIVSSASILAKVRRDNLIARLRERYGKLGSGYPADSVTLEFLRLWAKGHKGYPRFVRKSWKTVKRVRVEALEENRLDDYVT